MYAIPCVFLNLLIVSNFLFIEKAEFFIYISCIIYIW